MTSISALLCLTSLWRNLAHSSLQSCFSSLIIQLCTALLRFCHSFTIRLRSGLCLVDFLLCLESRSCYMIQAWSVKQMASCIPYSVAARCPGPVAVKQTQINKPSSAVLTVGMQCLCWCAASVFPQTRCYGLWPNISTSVLSLHRTLAHLCIMCMNIPRTN